MDAVSPGTEPAVARASITAGIAATEVTNDRTAAADSLPFVGVMRLASHAPRASAAG